MHLICSAPHCLFSTGQSTDPYFDKKIEVRGYGLCPRCGKQTPIQFFDHIDNVDVKKQFRAKKDMIIPKCESCGNSKLKIVLTQYVVSKHRKTRHYYYHDECWEDMLR